MALKHLPINAILRFGEWTKSQGAKSGEKRRCKICRLHTARNARTKSGQLRSYTAETNHTVFDTQLSAESAKCQCSNAGLQSVQLREWRKATSMLFTFAHLLCLGARRCVQVRRLLLGFWVVLINPSLAVCDYSGLLSWVIFKPLWNHLARADTIILPLFALQAMHEFAGQRRVFRSSSKTQITPPTCYKLHGY
jgi:hypothetical protein